LFTFTSLAPDHEYMICKGIKFIYLSGMARFLQENYSCITQRDRIRTLMRRPKGLENQEEDAAKSD